MNSKDKRNQERFTRQNIGRIKKRRVIERKIQKQSPYWKSMFLTKALKDMNPFTRRRTPRRGLEE